MVATTFADTTALLDAISAADETRVAAETLRLIGPQRVPPSKLAGRVGLAALWGACEPHALAAYAAVGRVAEWMRAVPAGPEPAADERRRLSPALPLVQGFLAVGEAVRQGQREPHPALPEPLMPDKVQNPDGPLGGLRDAFARRDLDQVRRLLLGYYATGTDYRSTVASLVAALAFRYPEAGHPLIFGQAGMQLLDLAGWGGNMPALIYWYPPLMLDDAPDTPVAQAARAFAAAPEHDLGWLRKRLAIPREEAAGARYQQALLTGDAQAACAATLEALRAGATPTGVAAGMALAVAGRIAALPEGDHAELMRAVHVLLYVHAVHVLLRQVQDPVVWPVLYTASAATNTLGALGGAAALEGASGTTVPALAGGGLIAATMLRTFEAQVASGDAMNGLITARRYIAMGNEPRALAGMVASVAAQRDLVGSDPDALHTLPAVAAAAEGYLLLPPALALGGRNALLTAAVRLASELRGPHAVADRVRDAINAQAG